MEVHIADLSTALVKNEAFIPKKQTKGQKGYVRRICVVSGERKEM